MSAPDRRANDPQRRPLILQQEGSDLSDLSNTPTFAVSEDGGPPSPYLSPPRRRPGYARLTSDTYELDNRRLHDDPEGEISATFGHNARDWNQGLGIVGTDTGAPPALPVPPASTDSPSGARRVSIQAIPRRPIGVKDSPGSADLLISPHGAFHQPGGRSPSRGPYDASISSLGDGHGHRHHPAASVSSLNSTPHQPYTYNEDLQRLRARPASVATSRSAYDNDFNPPDACPTKEYYYQPRNNWLAWSILALAVFSTVFSGIFLGIAWKGLRYGRRIRTHGSLTPANAALLTSIMAKLIELSFVTAFIAFLGQILSRRAVMSKDGKGVSLAELTMRNWIMQPGTLITHWEGVKYAGLSLLGIACLVATVMGTMYTSAATSVVQPYLKFGPWEDKLMVGSVSTSFANSRYIGQQCSTPISTFMDPEFAGTTCTQIEHAAQGYHNYQRYLSYWVQVADSGTGSTEMKFRPSGFGLLHENTTVNATWINEIPVPQAAREHGGRVIHNVSLAMPHAGVLQAATDPRNGIIQPDEVDNLGMYSLQASVPSPVVHVMCVNMNEKELEPLVYEKWPNAQLPVNMTSLRTADFTHNNRTAVDDIFEWSEEEIRRPPTFSRLPIEFNTVLNHTGRVTYGHDAIYLLGRSPPSLGAVYALCSMKVSLTPDCSSRYNASHQGATMEAICDPKEDRLAYIHSLRNATKGVTIPDWIYLGSEWANSLSLGTGLFDGNASNSRLLTQLIIPNSDAPDLRKSLPSPAEALAVMAGCTLLMSSEGAPFVPFFNYTAENNILRAPQTQYFNASLRAQEYASGGVDEKSKGFISVLFIVFVTNVLVLCYFAFHRGLVTDFSEPPNLFSLAVNSPPSQEMAGSCGAGPHGEQYKVQWYVNTEGKHVYMQPRMSHPDLPSAEGTPNGFPRRRRTGLSSMPGTPMSKYMPTFLKRRSMV